VIKAADATLCSSTFVDLRAERDAAEALRRSQLVPWGMELFLSEPSSPLDVCLRELRLSDAVVLIIGFYAGSLIPEAHGLTYTGAECQLAQQLGKPVFAFFKTEGGGETDCGGEFERCSHDL
jgi:hypothetical protein